MGQVIERLTTNLMKKCR